MPKPRMIPAYDLANLIAASAAGDQRSFRELYRSCAPTMLGLLMHMLKRRDLAEDALQDCFVNVWQKAKSYDAARGEPLAWLMTIARYRALDLLRNKKLSMEMPDEGGALSARIQDPSQSSEANAIELQGIEQVDRCLGTLSPHQRQSLLLAYYEGYTHQELSLHWRKPLGTVKSWVRRGLTQLRACLEQPAPST